MRFIIKIFAFFLLSVSIGNAQDLSREQKLQKIEELNNQIETLEKDVLSPAAKDLADAQKEEFNAIRLLPREKYDHKLTIRGGGAYYSFTRKTHEYGRGSDIALEQNYLSVGFAGADYGFIADLGRASLTDISEETVEANFLFNYKPPSNLSEIRLEQRKAHDYQVGEITYKSRLPVVVGHAYLVRSINFDDSDVLIALRIHRKDADGSLIIFWKILKTFEATKIARDSEN